MKSRLIVGLSITCAALFWACGNSSFTDAELGDPSEETETLPGNSDETQEGTDSETADAGEADGDVVLPADGGIPLPACPVDFGNCVTVTDFTATRSPEVKYGGELGPAYSPRCFKLKVNQIVHVRGQKGAKFQDYPLEQVCGPVNAFPRIADKPNAQLRFSAPGRYGFHSPSFADAGMVGAVEVIP